MVFTRLISIALAFASLMEGISPVSSFSLAADPSPWREIHSTHFTVITDAGEKRGTEVALRLEQMRAVFGFLLMKERLNDSKPLTVLAFKSDKDYYQSAPLRQGQPMDVPGFFLPSQDQNFIVLNLFEEESWRAVAHDFAHLMMNYNYPPVEGWFDEGVAEYFSSIRLDNKQYEIGGDPELTNTFSHDLLQNQTEVRNPPKSLTELLSGQVWLALPDLLTLKHDVSGHDEGTHHTLFYAQSWMMVHYLLHANKLPQTGAYFDLVENQHVSIDDAIQKAYGMTTAQLDQAVKDYFRSLTPLMTALDASKQPGASQNQRQVYQAPVPVMPNDSVITTSPMRETDARATVDEMKMRIPERRDAAVKDLQILATTATPADQKALDAASKKKESEPNGESTTLAAATGNEIAHRALAWDHLQRNEFDEATEELSDVAVLNSRDMWIRYYNSILKYKIAKAKHYDMQGLPNMMQDLRAVLDWYPQFADAYDLLAMARMVGGGSIAAMQAERAAMQLSPRDQEYIFHLAQIYIADKKWIAARDILERLKTSSNAQVAAEAKDQLGRLANEQKYGLATAANTPQFKPQNSPFDVLDEDAAKRSAATKTRQSSVGADHRSAKFIEGRLVSVDCSQTPAAILTVAANHVTLKLHTADYKSLLVIGAPAFSCLWVDRAVSINYKPGDAGGGDLVSVEVR